jgi:ParB-like chromosome segregation protein Spo0J
MCPTKTPDIDRQPIARVVWVEPATLRANSYNPNRVFGPEMRLLKLSILSHGWTQPIVARTDGEIVDGFHRWTLASGDEDIRALTGGFCPVVYLNGISLEEQMLATIRHNRARGQHGVLRMGEIVRALIDSGMDSAMVGSLLQMEDEEVERLADLTPSPQHAGKDHFGKGWVPTRG